MRIIKLKAAIFSGDVSQVQSCLEAEYFTKEDINKAVSEVSDVGGMITKGVLDYLMNYTDSLEEDDDDVYKSDSEYYDRLYEDNLPPIIAAAKNNRLDELRLLLESKDIDVNVRDKNGNTALIWAVIRRHESIVIELLKHNNIDVNAKNKMGSFALFIVVEDNKEPDPILEGLLQHHNINVNLQQLDGEKFTAFMKAISIANLYAVKTFIETGKVDYSIRDAEHDDVELIADSMNADSAHVGDSVQVVKSGVRETILKLVQSAIQKKTPDTSEQSSSTVADMDTTNDAGRNDDKEADDSKEYDERYRDWPPIVAAADCGNWKRVKELLIKNPSCINNKNPEGKTALLCAIEKDAADVFYELMDQPGIDVNAVADNGDFPLWCAIECKECRMIECLLAREDIDLSQKHSKQQKTADAFAEETLGIVSYGRYFGNYRKYERSITGRCEYPEKRNEIVALSDIAFVNIFQGRFKDITVRFWALMTQVDQYKGEAKARFLVAMYTLYQHVHRSVSKSVLSEVFSDYAWLFADISRVPDQLAHLVKDVDPGLIDLATVCENRRKQEHQKESLFKSKICKILKLWEPSYTQAVSGNVSSRSFPSQTLFASGARGGNKGNESEINAAAALLINAGAFSPPNSP